MNVNLIIKYKMDYMNKKEIDLIVNIQKVFNSMKTIFTSLR